jgi:hypothetical protein
LGQSSQLRAGEFREGAEIEAPYGSIKYPSRKCEDTVEKETHGTRNYEKYLPVMVLGERERKRRGEKAQLFNMFAFDYRVVTEGVVSSADLPR